MDVVSIAPLVGAVKVRCLCYGVLGLIGGIEMLKWLKEILAGDELRRKDETIQSYRDMLKQYEINHSEFNKIKLKAEILEACAGCSFNIDDAINAEIKLVADKYMAQQQAAMYSSLAAQQQMSMLGCSAGWQGGGRGLGSLGGLFGGH